MKIDAPEKAPEIGFRRIFVPPDNHFARSGANKLKRACSDEDPSEVTHVGVGDTDRMECLMEAGLPEAEFWEAFVQCAKCGHILPTSIYPYAHRCSKKVKIAMDVPKLEDLHYLEVLAAEADEEDRREEEEAREIERQLQSLQAAMRPRRQDRNISSS